MCHFLSKDCFCPSILTKLPLIDAVLWLCSEGCFCLAVLPYPHIYKRFQSCCLVLAHKDRHFMMELIKWSVADMRYINVYFGVIKQSIFMF